MNSSEIDGTNSTERKHEIRGNEQRKPQKKRSRNKRRQPQMPGGAAPNRRSGRRSQRGKKNIENPCGGRNVR